MSQILDIGFYQNVWKTVPIENIILWRHCISDKMSNSILKRCRHASYPAKKYFQYKDNAKNKGHNSDENLNAIVLT